MRWSDFAPWALAASWLVLWPAPGHAGPVEQLVQVAFHPTDPDVMVVRYIYGGTACCARMIEARPGS